MSKLTLAAQEIQRQRDIGHDAHQTRMRILTMRNDSSELNLAGAKALQSGMGNAKRAMLRMMTQDGTNPERERRLKVVEDRRKSMKRQPVIQKEKKAAHPEMSM